MCFFRRKKGKNKANKIENVVEDPVLNIPVEEEKKMTEEQKKQAIFALKKMIVRDEMNLKKSVAKRNKIADLLISIKETDPKFQTNMLLMKSTNNEVKKNSHLLNLKHQLIDKIELASSLSSLSKQLLEFQSLANEFNNEDAFSNLSTQIYELNNTLEADNINMNLMMQSFDESLNNTNFQDDSSEDEIKELLNLRRIEREEFDSELKERNDSINNL